MNNPTTASEMHNEKHTKIYNELFKRNFPIISNTTQIKIQKLNILVAGCGSTGGAFIEGASRLGVMNFKLAEPDSFDLNNLNRQFVFQTDLKKNKAKVHSDRLKNLFTDCKPNIEIFEEGVTHENVNILLNNVDIVFDAVDVTTKSGMSAKLLLHSHCAQKKVIVFSALDLAYKQWIKIFDYTKNNSPLYGKYDAATNCENPIKALIAGFCPLEDMSVEILEEIIRLLKSPTSNACQIAASCHLLSSFAGPLIVRYCEKKSLPDKIEFDLMRHLETKAEITQQDMLRNALQKEVQSLLASIS